MESVTDNSPLVVILGQTASGKSALAMDLAIRFGGEIIAADSRTIYRGMDIGTAKPSAEDQSRVRHHLLDVVNPDQSFTAADFQRLANEAIDDISGRGKLPILVGGSGLYVDAVIYDFGFRRQADDGQRSKLERLSVGELQNLIVGRGIALPENKGNARHLIRTLETDGELPRRQGLRPRTLVIGLLKEKEELVETIRLRVDEMVGRGFIDEVGKVVEKYGWDAPALQAPGYKAFRPYVAGQITLDEAKRQFVQNDVRYAKRQKTWFKRNPDINWISKSEDAVDLVTTFLNK